LMPGREVAGIAVTLSTARASLKGRLQLADGRPGSAFFIIMFSADKRAWQVDARRTQATRPADNGVFEIDDLPPGDYLVAAIWDFTPQMLTMPGFFERTAAAAVPVTLREGEVKEQDFRVQTTP
jgi:hypothetical protein